MTDEQLLNDPVMWLNGQLDKKDPSLVLAKLHISLQLTMQQLTEQLELASAQYLTILPALQREGQKMADETQDAISRIQDILIVQSDNARNCQTPATKLLQINEAEQKISMILRILKKITPSPPYSH